jgi:IclR family transcriptional regulator, KDG regulon repressor
MAITRVERGRDRSSVERESGQVKILSRAVAVLDAFTTQRPQLTLADLSELLAVNKPTLLRILRTLEDEGLLVRHDKTYQLGPRVLSIGNVYLSTLSVHEAALPDLNDLAEKCGQTVNLAMLDDLEVVYLAILHAQTVIGIQGEIGGRHPAHATSLGKVLLADLPDVELRKRLASKPLVKLTNNTITDPRVLLDHVQQVRRQGFAVDLEERSTGVRCVAAPIRNRLGKAVMAASIAGPIFNMADARIPSLCEDLTATVTAISAKLGFRTP